VSSKTELTGLVPRVGVLLFEADSESDTDSGQEPGLRGTPLRVYVYLAVSVCGAFINMPLFELHACVRNYHICIITNTNVVANKPSICKNKGCYYWQNNNKHTLFSQKNKDKSNEVT